MEIWGLLFLIGVLMLLFTKLLDNKLLDRLWGFFFFYVAGVCSYITDISGGSFQEHLATFAIPVTIIGGILHFLGVRFFEKRAGELSVGMIIMVVLIFSYGLITRFLG